MSQLAFEFLSPDEQVERLYQLYPRKIGKKAAVKAIVKALQLTPYQSLKVAVEMYSEVCGRVPKERRRFIPHPSTWFNQGRWEDDPREWESGLLSNGKPSPYQGLREFLEESGDEPKRIC